MRAAGAALTMSPGDVNPICDRIGNAGLEFSLDPGRVATTAQAGRPDDGRVRRVELPAPLFAWFGVIFTILGIVIVVLAVDTETAPVSAAARDAGGACGMARREAKLSLGLPVDRDPGSLQDRLPGWPHEQIEGDRMGDHQDRHIDDHNDVGGAELP